MKRMFGILILIAVITSAIFARDESPDTLQNKRQPLDNYLGPGLGMGGMKLNDGAIFTIDFGISYDFYLLSWLSINTGIYAHQEIYHNQPSDDKRIVPKGNPFCFTIPFGIHINIPKAEWLYTGFNIGLNIPIFDIERSTDLEAYTKDDFFVSLPVDLGFDLIRPGKGGSRVFFRITPAFHKGGIALPIGLVWQIHNWKIGPKKIEVTVPPPPVPPTTIIIIQ